MIVGACEERFQRTRISAIRLHHMGGYSEVPSKAPVASVSNRVSRSCACSRSPTWPPVVYSTTRPIPAYPQFFLYFTLSHVKLRPFPNRRDFHCDHPHPRSGCCRKSKLGSPRSASVIPSSEMEMFIAFAFRSPLGAPMGMAPVTHVLFTRSVYCHRARPLCFIERFGQVFQC